MPKPLIFVIIVMLIMLPRSSSSSMIMIISTIIMFARRWRRQHSISDLLKEPVAQEAIQVQFCFLEHCNRSLVQILIILIFNFMIITKPNPVQYLNQGFFKAVPPQELWQGLLKEGDHWRDIYDDMHKVNHFHNHCHHDP